MLPVIAGYNRSMTKDGKTGLWLVRFALVSYKPAIKDPNFVLKVEDVEVKILAVVKPKDNDPQILIEARKELKTWPIRTPDGTIIVPKDARNSLEEWIEYTVNLMAVGNTSSRHLSSPSVTIAFLDKTPEAEQWLSEAVGYKGQEVTAIAGAEMPVMIQPEILSQLGDRLNMNLSSLLTYRHFLGLS
jgi:hypothetical protein